MWGRGDPHHLYWKNNIDVIIRIKSLWGLNNMGYYTVKELKEKLEGLNNFKSNNREYELKDAGVFLLKNELDLDGHVQIHSININNFNTIRLKKVKGVNNVRVSSISLTRREGLRFCEHSDATLSGECLNCGESYKSSKLLNLATLSELQIANELKILSATRGLVSMTDIAEALIVGDRSSLLRMIRMHRSGETESKIERFQDRLNLLPHFKEIYCVKDIGGMLVKEDITSRLGPTLIDVKGVPGNNYIVANTNSIADNGLTRRLTLSDDEAKIYCSHRRIVDNKCRVCGTPKSYALHVNVNKENLLESVSDIKPYLNIGASPNLSTSNELMVVEALLNSDYKTLSDLSYELVMTKNIMFKGELDHLNDIIMDLVTHSKEIKVDMSGYSRKGADYFYTNLLDWWKPSEIHLTVSYRSNSEYRDIEISY